MSEKSTTAAVPEAQQSAQERVKEITDRLEAGLKALFEGDNFRNYLNTMSKFHNYSFNNTMLIALQKPEATYVAGFNKWKKDFERSVNKGEKGIKIFAPAPYKVKKEQEKIDPETDLPVLDKDGNPVMEEVTVTIPAFKVVSVFDVSQTNGKELPTLGVDELKGNVENFEKFFGVLKEVSPVPIKFAEVDGSAKGFYHQTDKEITIKLDMPEVQTIKTAIHEIAHAKLHDRDLRKSDLDNPKDTRTKEVEAESIAYTVCQHFGIDTSDYSFAYVASWGSGVDTPELKSSLETIRATASELITQIEDKLRGLEKERTVYKAFQIPDDVRENAKKAFVVNLYGGPGIGKSTTALQLVAELKKRGINADYVSEVAKELVYAHAFDKLDGSIENQREILSRQRERLDIIAGNVDVAVTDASLMLNTVYLAEKNSEYTADVLNQYNEYNNFNFYLERDTSTPFEQEGRIHNLEQSIEKDKEILSLLIDNNLEFEHFDRNDITRMVNEITAKFPQKTIGNTAPSVDKPTEEKPRNSNIIGNTPYKDIPDKSYLKIQTSLLPSIEKMLAEENIAYSGRKTGKTTTITVSEKDYSLLSDFVTAQKAFNDISEKSAKQNSNIIGNTEYKDIPDKFFIRMSASKAQEIAAALEANGLRFSGRIDGDKATLTISKADKDTYRQLTTVPSREEVTKSARAALIGAMKEYDEADKAAVIADEKLNTAMQEYDEVKDENGQISDPELKKKLMDNIRSAATLKETADKSLSEKTASLNIAETDFKAVMSSEKTEPEYTGRLPDESMSISQMEEYGYKFADENQMLPLGAEKAAQLLELGTEVYRLYEDDTEGLIQNPSEITEHKGLFGVEKAEWEKVLPLVEHLEALNAAQPQREEFLLHGDVPAAVGIYQLNEGAETRGIRYMSSEYLESMGIVPERDKYTLVYSFEAIPEDLNNKAEFLDKVFEKYSSEPPADYSGRSLSVSDVIVIRNGDDLSAHYVDSAGFKELENFGEVHRKPELTAETAEQSEKTFIPLYKNDVMFAKENSEIEEWRSSINENRSCARAIDKALSDNFADNHLDTDKALDTVIAEYGAERVTHVLAAQVVNHDWDGRYHNDVKAWAKEQTKDLSAEFIEKSRDYYLSSHPILIDGLASTVMTREKELEKAVSHELALESAEQNGVNIISFSEQDGQIFAEVTQGEKSSVVPVKRTDEDIAYIEVGGKPNKLSDIQSYDLEQFEIYRSPITHDINGYHADDLDKGDTIKLDGELWTVKSKSTYSISLVNDNGKKNIYNSPESKWQETITKAGFEFVSDEPVPRERTSNEQETRKPARAQPKPTPAKPEAEKKPSVIGAIEELKKNCSKQPNAKENEKGAVAL